MALFCATFLVAASFFGWLVILSFVAMTTYAATSGLALLYARHRLLQRSPSAPKLIRWSAFLALPGTLLLAVVGVRLVNQILDDPWMLTALPIVVLAHVSGILLIRTARSSTLDAELWRNAGDPLHESLNYADDDDEVELDLDDAEVPETVAEISNQRG